MLKNFLLTSTLCVAILLILPTGAFALDEDSDSLMFIQSDAPAVIAIDMDEFNSYAVRVGRSWRDADFAHFFGGIETISWLMSRDNLIPDFRVFYSRLSGVQAFSIDGSSAVPLVVFSADNATDGKIIGNYALATYMELKLYDSLKLIMHALDDYRYDYDEETDSWINDGYPGDIYDLVEYGYLESMPINPYTGEPIRFLDKGEEPSYGDMIYERGDFESDDTDMESGAWPMYKLSTFCIGGVNISPGWANNFIPSEDFTDRLLSLTSDYDFSSLGFDVETDGDWTFCYPEGTDFAFAMGGMYFLFSENMDVLEDAVGRYGSGDGFAFSTPSDFDTSGAFMRSQGNPGGMINMMSDPVLVLGPGEHEEMPPEVEQMMENIYGSMGLDAIKMQHGACWLRNSDIEMVRRTELSGDATNSFIGSMLNAEPELLMTAENGPLGIIGEIAWANPDEFVHAYLDFVFETVFPMIADKIGMDPQMMLSMIGLEDINNMEFGDSMYILITESEDRGDGIYIPGLNAIVETGDEDMFYTAVNVVDTLIMMVPDLPMSQVETGDDNVFTWALDIPGIPISVTLARTDDYFIKGIFQDDVLAIRDALENGEMLSPDGLGPANERVRVNRQQLLRGIADVMYLLPEGMSAAGAMFESLALMSDADERLFAEAAGNGEYVESSCYFSIDLFERLIPAIAYVMNAANDM